MVFAKNRKIFPGKLTNQLSLPPSIVVGKGRKTAVLVTLESLFLTFFQHQKQQHFNTKNININKI